MLYGYVRSKDNRPCLMVAAASTVVEFEVFQSNVTPTPYVTTGIDFMLNPGIYARFVHPIYEFSFDTDAEIEEFRLANEIKVLQSEEVKDLHVDMMNDMHVAVQRASQHYDNRKIGEIHGLNKRDPWDSRSDEQKAAALEVGGKMVFGQEPEGVMGDSFGFELGQEAQEDQTGTHIIGINGKLTDQIQVTLKHTGAKVEKIINDDGRSNDPLDYVYAVTEGKIQPGDCAVCGGDAFKGPWQVVVVPLGHDYKEDGMFPHHIATANGGLLDINPDLFAETNKGIFDSKGFEELKQVRRAMNKMGMKESERLGRWLSLMGYKVVKVVYEALPELDLDLRSDEARERDAATVSSKKKFRLSDTFGDAPTESIMPHTTPLPEVMPEKVDHVANARLDSELTGDALDKALEGKDRWDGMPPPAISRLREAEELLHEAGLGEIVFERIVSEVPPKEECGGAINWSVKVLVAAKKAIAVKTGKIQEEPKISPEDFGRALAGNGKSNVISTGDQTKTKGILKEDEENRKAALEEQKWLDGQASRGVEVKRDIAETTKEIDYDLLPIEIRKEYKSTDLGTVKLGTYHGLIVGERYLIPTCKELGVELTGLINLKKMGEVTALGLMESNVLSKVKKDLRAWALLKITRNNQTYTLVSEIH